MIQKNRVILGFGSNVGNRKLNIEKAIQKLKEHYFEPIKISSLLETKAMIVENQPNFLNAIGIFLTHVSPFEVLEITQKIEKEVGRIYRFPKGPREIDIDILDYEHKTINSIHLILPHRSIWEREYQKKLLEELGIWKEFENFQRFL